MRSLVLLFAMILIQTTSSFATIYARLHYTYTYVSPVLTPSWSNWGGWYSGNTTVTIEFFSDAACTIPTTTVREETVSLQGKDWYKHVETPCYYSEYGADDSNNSFEITVPEGVSSYDYGALEYYNETEWQQESGIGYDYSSDYVLDRTIYYHEISNFTGGLIAEIVDSPQYYSWPSVSGQ